MSRAIFAGLLAAILFTPAGCLGTIIVEDGATPTGPLYCPQEDDGCPAQDGIPAPVIIEADAGADADGDAP
jgi:hypothetical protein